MSLSGSGVLFTAYCARQGDRPAAEMPQSIAGFVAKLHRSGGLGERKSRLSLTGVLREFPHRQYITINNKGSLYKKKTRALICCKNTILLSSGLATCRTTNSIRRAAKTSSAMWTGALAECCTRRRCRRDSPHCCRGEMPTRFRSATKATYTCIIDCELARRETLEPGISFEDSDL